MIKSYLLSVHYKHHCLLHTMREKYDNKSIVTASLCQEESLSKYNGSNKSGHSSLITIFPPIG